MLVLKNNIYVGNKCKCVKYSSTSTCCGFLVKKDVLLLRTEEDTFIEIDDILESKLPKRLAMSMLNKYNKFPTKIGELFVCNLERAYGYNLDNNETVNLHDLKEDNLSQI
ncbi:MAG: hypothetical protein IJW36_02110 [Clostridia bacterium]|nr:hypothetical protein [Clostridia bacterium]